MDIRKYLKLLTSNYVISIVTLDSEYGKELADGLLKLFVNPKSKCKRKDDHFEYKSSNVKATIKVYDRSIFNVSVTAGMLCCIESDLVIWDGSIEGANNEINNYDIANAIDMQLLDHVWIVSRTYLPMNITPLIKGGFPTYKERNKTNEEILNWLKSNIQLLDYKKRNVLLKDIFNIQKKCDVLNSNKAKILNEHLFGSCSAKRVFVSFRTKYINRTQEIVSKNYKYSVSELSERIQSGNYHGEKCNVVFLDNGTLVYDTELVTKWKAWSLLSIIESEYLSYCDEMWIYGSDDYLDSWWTIGEELMFSYILERGIDYRQNKENHRKLIFYDPKSDIIKEISKLSLDKKILSDIAHIVTDCDPKKVKLYTKLSVIMWRNILFGSPVDFERGESSYLLGIMACVRRDLKIQGFTKKEAEEYISN